MVAKHLGFLPASSAHLPASDKHTAKKLCAVETQNWDSTSSWTECEKCIILRHKITTGRTAVIATLHHLPQAHHRDKTMPMSNTVNVKASTRAILVSVSFIKFQSTSPSPMPHRSLLEDVVVSLANDNCVGASHMKPEVRRRARRNPSPQTCLLTASMMRSGVLLAHLQDAVTRH